MATELTPQFRQAEAELAGAETPEARLAAIQKMRAELDELETSAEMSALQAKIHPMIRLAHEAFQRDLPELIQMHKGWWVAYHGDRRLGMAPVHHDLYQQFWSNGVPEDELLVKCIERLPDEYRIL